jgi:glycine C-acetyltransferase
VYVVGFSFPVVPKGQARIRTQVSAAHELRHLDRGIEAFVKVGETYGVLHKGKREIVEAYGA